MKYKLTPACCYYTLRIQPFSHVTLVTETADGNVIGMPMVNLIDYALLLRHARVL